MTTEHMVTTLQSYTPARVRDAWMNLGGHEATDSTPAYFAGLLYKINNVDSALHGFIVFFTDPVMRPIVWTDYQYINDEIQHVDTLHIPSEFYIRLTADEYEAIEDAHDSSFLPFQEGTVQETAPSVHIPEHDLHVILRDAGIPFVKWDELEYSITQMKYLIIRPALDEFYKYFPIIRHETYPVGGQGRFDIDYPDDPNFISVVAVFGANSNEHAHNVGMGNPFQYYRDRMIGGLMIGQQFPGGQMGHRAKSGRSGPMGFNHNDIVTSLQHQATYNSLLGKYSRISYKPTETGIQGFHTAARFVTVEWGFRSDDWTKLPHERMTEVRKLAAAYALRTFAMLRNQSPSNSPGKVDYSGWLETADKWEEQVLTHWADFTKAVVIRSR